MARRRRYSRREPDMGGLIVLAILLIAGWWIRNIGGFSSLLAFVVLCIAGYFGIRFWLSQRAQNRLAASGIDEVDRMSGVEFERFALAHFKRKGYRAKDTPKQSDYGGDLVLQKDGRTVVVQAKRWGGVVGIKAVQEVLGALNYYGADKGIVLTNSDFSENAYELARRSRVELWNRQKLTQDLMAEGGRPDVEISTNTSNVASDSRTCPRCGRTLVVRSGRRGKFWGCTGFPECRYTADV